MMFNWLSNKVDKRQSWWDVCYLSPLLYQAVKNQADKNKSAKVDFKNLDSLMSSSEHLLKHDLTTSVARVEIAGHPIVLKRYNARSRWHRVKRAFRQSRARRCWSMSYEFARAGLCVAEPAIMFEQRFGPIRRNAFFASGYLSGQELLTLLPNMSFTSRKKVAAAYRQCLVLMRRYLITHGDMKASNLIWKDDKLFFIDLDAARKHNSQRSWHRAHHRDMKRFLKNWRANPELLELFSYSISQDY